MDAIKKELVLSAYEEGMSLKIEGSTFKVVNVDKNRLVLEPVETNILGKFKYDFENLEEKCTDIQDGRMVTSTTHMDGRKSKTIHE